MPSCAIITCRARSQVTNKEGGSVSFHRFPKDPDIKEQWIDVTGRENWFPSTNSTVCSKHFKENDFILKKSGYRYLKPGAIPKEKVTLIYSGLFPVSLRHDDVTVKKSSKDGTNTNHNLANAQDLRTYFQEFTPESNSKQNSVNPQENLISSNASTPRKRKLQNIIENKEHIIKKQRLQIRRIQTQNRRLKVKINKIEEVLKDLQGKFNLKIEDMSILTNMNLKVQELTKRMFEKSTTGHSKQKYSPALRSFALTLNYYSPKAYEYVRNTFDTCLPHRRTLQKWYQNVGGGAGFTTESIEALKIKAKNTKDPIIAALSIDEMAIRRRVEWDGRQLHGHVDIGNGVEGDHVGVAKEALVFLVTGVNCNFKVPVGYFLVDGISGTQRADLILQCLKLISETGINIISLTFDGCAANLAMTQSLGCSIKDKKIVFSHPTTKDPVAVLLDPSHMIKLIRNAFQCYKVFLDKDGNKIEWRFLQELNKIQMEEKFHLANKLRYRHINFKNNKMKVKLATQLFSTSVADAIDFCRDKLNLPTFKNSEATSNFLRIINNMFDIFNSRNTFEYKFKKALTETNAPMLLEYLQMTTKYLSELKTPDGILLKETLRKTGFVGFIGCAVTVEHFYKTLICSQILKFMPFYKVSQDHLEMLFGNIRSHGGCNNNPTARQFKAAYKKLLVHIELKPVENGNCTNLEHISILHCASSPIDRINGSTNKLKIEEDENENTNDVEVESMHLFLKNLSEFSNQIISHIAGYIAHVLIKKIQCDTCIGALLSNDVNDEHKFIVAKDKGGLLYPSKDLIKICKISECVVRTCTDNLQSIRKDFLISKILRHFVGSDIFNELVSHQIGQYPDANHITDLKKAIIEKYIDLRLHFILKTQFAMESKRQLLNKFILFKGQ